MRRGIHWFNAGNLRPPSHYKWLRCVPHSEQNLNAQSLYNAVTIGEAWAPGTQQKFALYYLLTDDPCYPPGPDLHGGDVVSIAVGDVGPPIMYDFAPYSVEVDTNQLHSFSRSYLREKSQSEKVKRMVDAGYSGKKVVGVPRTELRQPFKWLNKQWNKVSRRKA